MSLLEFLPEALEEVVEAARWYEQEREGLGQEFMDELETRLRRAVAVPGAGRLEPNAPDRFALRWYALKRFPYASGIVSLVPRVRLGAARTAIVATQGRLHTVRMERWR